MLVREGRAESRRTRKRAAGQNTAQYKIHTIPAPVRGWSTAQGLISADPRTARVLDNYFPEQDMARLRGGSDLHATIGNDPVSALFNYKTASAEKRFAADASAIYDRTAPADPEVPPSAAVSGQTGGYYSTQQFATAGGEFLYAVNGADSAQLFDGSSWAAITGVSTPAITGVTTSELSHVWSYRNRLYFVQVDTLSAWFLPVDSIGGAATEISLAGIFQRGGSLLFGATWSLDAGDGIDDKWVAVSTEGEVAVYEGSYPGGSDWSLVGRYEINAPLGKNAIMQAGGDLLIASNDGIVPVSAIIQKDPAALAMAAVTREIEPDWRVAVRDRSDIPWELLKWPGKKRMIVGLPSIIDTTAPMVFVANLETGAWCRYPGWDVRSLSLFGSGAYAGTSTGTIIALDTASGTDQGMPYTGVYVSQFSDLGSPGQAKHVIMARATYLSGRPFNAKLTATTDYQIDIPAVPKSVDNYSTGNEWDVGLWDVAVWDGGGIQEVNASWEGIGVTGYAIAPVLQITSGTNLAPDVGIVSIDLTYEPGAVLV